MGRLVCLCAPPPLHCWDHKSAAVFVSICACFWPILPTQPCGPSGFSPSRRVPLPERAHPSALSLHRTPPCMPRAPVGFSVLYWGAHLAGYWGRDSVSLRARSITHGAHLLSPHAAVTTIAPWPECGYSISLLRFPLLRPT